MDGRQCGRDEVRVAGYMLIPATSRAGTRDGSRFPFSHFSGTIRLWRNDHPAGSGPVTISATRRVGKPTRSLFALLHLSPPRPVRQSFPTILTTNLVYDEWPNFLGNRPMVEALLSRLRHYCHTVVIDGPPLREPQG